MSEAKDGWTVAILSSRETWEQLGASIAAALQGAGPPRCVEVVVNGNPGLAETAASQLRAAAMPAHRVRVWSIAMADKANALNAVVHHLATPDQGCFFLDGYVCVAPQALQHMADALRANPDSFAVAAVPTAGRSADMIRQDMLQNGGLHGNLFALAPSTMTALRERDIRIPVGMYRTDGTLGAMLAFALDPAMHEWCPLQHIHIAEQATWTVVHARESSLQQWLLHWKRLRRQARGHLENMAVRHHLAVCQRAPEALGRHIRQVVDAWKLEAPGDFKRALGLHPLRWLERNGWTAALPAVSDGAAHGQARLLLDRA